MHLTNQIHVTTRVNLGRALAALNRYSWLYTRMLGLFRKESAILSQKPLIEPCLTPATQKILKALRAELEEATQISD